MKNPLVEAIRGHYTPNQVVYIPIEFPRHFPERIGSIEGPMPLQLERIAHASERRSGTRFGLTLVGIGLLVAALVAGGLYKAYKTMNSPAYRALIEEAAETPGTPINKARYR